MNALWISRMSLYKSSDKSILSAQAIIVLKISRQAILLKRYERRIPTYDTSPKNSINEILLGEARFAKYFWREFRYLLPKSADFAGRIPRSNDVVNKLLDIGYHHICNIIKNILDKRDISTALGLLHVAKTSKSNPLVYDLVEMFRSDIVDSEVLRFLRLKKRPIVSIEKEVSRFLYRINKRLDRKYYIKSFKICETYRYYIELQILSFISAVNNKEVFKPIQLPTRHENRCRI